MSSPPTAPRRYRGASHPLERQAVLCERLLISGREAVRRAQRLRRFSRAAPALEASLLYKPHWYVPARLERRGRGTTREWSGSVIVDGLTGIARPRPADPASIRAPAGTERRPLEPELLFQPAIDVHGATGAAMRVLERLGRRRGVRSAHISSRPCLYYKPVWVVREAEGTACEFVVDGHTGLAARTLP